MTKMTKIERAILKVKLQILEGERQSKVKERELLIIQTQLKCLTEQLDLLEVIKDDKSIPNETKK